MGLAKSMNPVDKSCSWRQGEARAPVVLLGVCRAFVQGKRGSFMSVMVHSVHNNIVLHIGTPCCLF